MSRSSSPIQTHRQFARGYRRILALAVPTALAACQGATDPLAPDAAGDASAPAAIPVTEAAAPSSSLLTALTSNRIAFMANTAGGGMNVWTMDPQGGTPAPVTSFNDLGFDPSWSYDLKHFAFERLRGSFKDIYLVDADKTHQRWARSATYPGSIVEPSWSPDGTHLLVSVVIGSAAYLAKIDLATENLALVAPMGFFAVAGSYPTYDPTGKTIFYVDNDSKTIKRFTPGGAQTTVFTSRGYVGGLAISPDGTRLAYSATVTGMNSEIFVLNLATKVTKRLTYNSAVDHSATWSPDGTKLAFSSYRTGKMQIWTMNSSTGGSLTRITSGAYGASSPVWR
jgi:Tol biopolymer transport system component